MKRILLVSLFAVLPCVAMDDAKNKIKDGSETVGLLIFAAAASAKLIRCTAMPITCLIPGKDDVLIAGYALGKASQMYRKSSDVQVMPKMTRE